MRILHVIMSLAERWGGPPRALATLSRAQAERGDDVVVLPTRDDGGEVTIGPGSYGGLRVERPVTTSPLYWYHPAVKRALRELARESDIVHIHGNWRYHLLGAAAAAREYGVPYVVRPTGNLDSVCRHHKHLRKQVYFMLFERRAINHAAALHCASPKEYDELTPLALRPRKFIVPNPVQTELLSMAPDEAALLELCPGLRLDRPIVAYHGRIAFKKRVEIVLEGFARAAADFPDWQLVIAGPHEDEQIIASLRERIEAGDLERRVWLPGMVRGAAKSALLGRTQLYAFASSDENFGISVAEAMLFGLPCVVSAGVALAADIERAGAGMVVPGDADCFVDSFAGAMRAMMSDAEQRRRCGQAARDLARTYLPESVAAALDVEYRRCIGRS